MHKIIIPWNKGMKGYSTSKKGTKTGPRSKEVREKISQGMIGKNTWMKGRKLSEETKEKIALNGFHYGMKGKHHTEEAKIKIGEFNKDKFVSQETRDKIRLNNSGENSHFWKGGVSFEPYPLGWTKIFKEQIRARDNYTCQNLHCGVPEVECGRKLDVHHVDYNKSNLDRSNLISLCKSCHSKTQQD